MRALLNRHARLQNVTYGTLHRLLTGIDKSRLRKAKKLSMEEKSWIAEVNASGTSVPDLLEQYPSLMDVNVEILEKLRLAP